MDRINLNDKKKKQIEDCLLELMGEIPYMDISVKDITERLGMARKTFYHYFSGKNACLESMMDRVIGEYCLKEIIYGQKLMDVAKLHEKRIYFWIEHKSFLDALNKNKLPSMFLDRFLIYIHREDTLLRNQLDRPHVEYDEDILFFFMTGYLFLLLKWCHEGFSLPMEDMVRKIIRLTHEPLLSPEE